MQGGEDSLKRGRRKEKRREREERRQRVNEAKETKKRAKRKTKLAEEKKKTIIKRQGQSRQEKRGKNMCTEDLQAIGQEEHLTPPPLKH